MTQVLSWFQVSSKPIYCNWVVLSTSSVAVVALLSGWFFTSLTATATPAYLKVAVALGFRGKLCKCNYSKVAESTNWRIYFLFYSPILFIFHKWSSSDTNRVFSCIPVPNELFIRILLYRIRDRKRNGTSSIINRQSAFIYRPTTINYQTCIRSVIKTPCYKLYEIVIKIDNCTS